MPKKKKSITELASYSYVTDKLIDKIIIESRINQFKSDVTQQKELDKLNKIKANINKEIQELLENEYLK